MGTISQASGACGPGKRVYCNKQWWTLTKMTKGMQAEFGAWLAERAEKAAMLMAEKYRKRSRELWKEAKRIQKDSENPELPLPEQGKLADEYDDVSGEARSLEIEARNIVERYTDRIAAGEFEFHGNVSIGIALQNLPGQARLTWIMLRQKHPTLTLDEVIEMHKGFLLSETDERPVFRKGDRIPMTHAWQEAILEVEGLKNDEPGPSEASTVPTPTTKNS